MVQQLVFAEPRPSRPPRHLADLDAAGGYGWKADEGNTQIIKGKTGDTFLASSESKYVLEPGDRIYVPEEPPSDFWKGFASVITVIAQIGTIAAVVVSIAVSTKR